MAKRSKDVTTGPNATASVPKPVKTRLKSIITKRDGSPLPPPKKRGPAPQPRKTKPPKVKSGHAPTAKDLEIIKRRDEVLNLRESGMSIRAISEQLKKAGFAGSSPTRIHELLCEALEELYKTQRMKTRHLIVLESNKIDRAETVIFPKLAKATDADAVEKLSRSLDRIWKRRDAMLGLHKPQKLELSARDALAKLIGRSPEEIPDGDSDS